MTNICVDNVRKFFTATEWNSLAPIERVRSAKVFENYQKMAEIGISVQPPDFIQRHEERQHEERIQRQPKPSVRCWKNEERGCVGPPSNRRMVHRYPVSEIGHQLSDSPDIEDSMASSFVEDDWMSSESQDASEFSGFSSDSKDIVMNKQSLSIHHSEGGKYKCCVCSHRVSTKKSLSVHLMIHTGELPFKCDECGLGFRAVEHLKRHIRRFSSRREFQCSYCSHTFRFDKNRKMHEKIHSEAQIPCCICGLLMSGIRSLRNHIAQNHHHIAKHQCSVCKKFFSSTSHLKRHERSFSQHHTYHCRICSHTFPSAMRLKRHMTSHRNLKFIKCKYCFQQYNSQSQLDKHLKKRWQFRKHVCQGCKCIFQSTVGLERHQHAVSSNKPFQCSECGHTYSSLGHLNSHRKLHSQDGCIWKCKFCDKSFTKKIFLKTHMQIHSHHSEAVVKQSKPHFDVQIKTVCKHGIACCELAVVQQKKSKTSLFYKFGVAQSNLSSCGEGVNDFSVITESSYEQAAHQPDFTQHLASRAYRNHQDLEVMDNGTETDDSSVDEEENLNVNKELGVQHFTNAGTKHLCYQSANTQMNISSNFQYKEKCVTTSKSLCNTSGKHKFVTKKISRAFRTMECPRCHKTIPSYNFKRHMVVHSDTRPFKCSVCHKTYKRKDYLIRHNSSAHG